MKKIIAAILTIVMTCNLLCNAAETYGANYNTAKCLSKQEMKKITNSMSLKDADIDVGDNYSSKEIKDILNSVEDIGDVSYSEDNVTVNKAVEDIFDSKHNSQTADSVVSKTVDGRQYIIEIYKSDKSNYVRLYSTDGAYLSQTEISDNIASVDSYVYDTDKNSYINKNIHFKYTNSVKEKNTFTAQAVNYGSVKKSAKWKDKTYWYAIGSLGKKTYLKIGQKATYVIRTDKFTSGGTKENNCNGYTSAVKKSKSYYLKGAAELSGTSFSVGFIVGLIISYCLFAPSVMFELILGAVDGLSGCAAAVAGVKNLINSYEKWEDASDYYIVIRTYGEKQ